MFPDRDFNMTVNGPTDVTSNIFPLRDANITQNSLASGNTTTFAGTITALNDINITNNGGITSKLYVDSAVTATSTWDGVQRGQHLEWRRPAARVGGERGGGQRQRYVDLRERPQRGADQYAGDGRHVDLLGAERADQGVHGGADLGGDDQSEQR